MSVVLRWLIRFYQVVISPAIGPRCRFYPTCSQYALEAISRYGAGYGSVLTAKRLCRCHPWGGHGYDPVPARARRYFFVAVNTRIHPPVPFVPDHSGQSSNVSG